MNRISHGCFAIDIVCIIIVLTLISSCNRIESQKAYSASGLLIDGQPARTILLHGHCKLSEDFIYDETRFAPVWHPENVLTLSPGIHFISVIFEQTSTSYLGETIKSTSPPLLVYFKLSDDLRVLPQPELDDEVTKRLNGIVAVLESAVVVRGKSAPAGDELISETFLLNLPKGRYVIANPLEPG